MDSPGEMLITIMASLAQQESQSISQNVRMGHQYRMQQGKPMVTTWFMGYRMSEDKDHLVIVPEQAVVVRRIFREFLDGRTTTEIAEGLMADGIPSPSHKEKWYPGTVESMLKNEKFMGDLLMQKWYIQDFISKKAVRNNGTFPKYYVENAHEPIVPREVFMMVKGEFLQREYEKAESGKKTVHRSGLPFYEKIVCGECGNTYRRFSRKDIGRTEWRCKTRIMKGTPCVGRIVMEEDVKNTVVKAFSGLPAHKAELASMNNDSTQVAEIQSQIDALMEKEDALHDRISRYAETGAIETGAHNENRALADNEKTAVELEFEQMKANLDKIADEKNELLRQKAEHNRRQVHARNLLSLIGQMENPSGMPESSTFQEEIQRQLKAYPVACSDVDDFFRRTARGRITASEFSEDLVNQYIEKIIVRKNRMTVVFKAGISVDIEG